MMSKRAFALRQLQICTASLAGKFSRRNDPAAVRGLAQ